MPMISYLKGQEFDPELIEAMSAAFVEACGVLGLAVQADPITELVAQQIIEAAQRGMRTKTALYLTAILEFKANPH